MFRKVSEQRGLFHVKHMDFDVVVIGGGHAGAEAAQAAKAKGSKPKAVKTAKAPKISGGAIIRVAIVRLPSRLTIDSISN